MYADVPDVFVAGDLLWYPVEGNNKISAAPDAMAVFGRPKGDRGSYRTWEEDHISPQVVFEIRSPSNTDEEMADKLRFYERYDVEEYYLYDPDKNELQGWIRRGNILKAIEQMQGWVSPRLKIRFEPGEDLSIIRPDGEKFLTSIELDHLLQAERQRAERLAAKLRELGIELE
jgi:Uma2 family endonuclease